MANDSGKPREVHRWSESCDGEFYEVVSSEDYDELAKRFETAKQLWADLEPDIHTLQKNYDRVKQERDKAVAALKKLAEENAALRAEVELYAKKYKADDIIPGDIDYWKKSSIHWAQLAQKEAEQNAALKTEGGRQVHLNLKLAEEIAQLKERVQVLKNQVDVLLGNIELNDHRRMAIVYGINEELTARCKELEQKVSQTWDTPGGKRIYAAMNRIERLERALEYAMETWNVLGLKHFSIAKHRKEITSILTESEGG